MQEKNPDEKNMNEKNMDQKSVDETWNGYRCKKIIFEGHEGFVVFPKEKANGYLALKTEYWGAFPEALELPLLEKGFHLCFIKNDNRWGTNDNLDRQARFVRSCMAEYDLKSQCVPVGMSCGGLIAIKLAARYPELVKCLYLDAPVVNYMSCPCGFGIGNPLNEDYSEILNALKLSSLSELLSYRDMPLDKLEILTRNGIPAVMVAGDSDTTVPYCENGIFVERAYKEAGVELEVYIVPGKDHHPHGLKNPQKAVEFVMRHCN